MTWPREGTPLRPHDPLEYRRAFVAGVRGNGPPAPGPFFSGRVTEYLRQYLTLPGGAS